MKKKKKERKRLKKKKSETSEIDLMKKFDQYLFLCLDQ